MNCHTAGVTFGLAETAKSQALGPDVAELRLAPLRIRELLAPEGGLLFEVSLRSNREDNSVWL